MTIQYEVKFPLQVLKDEHYFLQVDYLQIFI